MQPKKIQMTTTQKLYNSKFAEWLLVVYGLLYFRCAISKHINIQDFIETHYFSGISQLNAMWIGSHVITKVIIAMLTFQWQESVFLHSRVFS